MTIMKNDIKGKGQRIGFRLSLKYFLFIFVPLLALLSGISILFYRNEAKVIEKEERFFEIGEINNVSFQMKIIVNDFDMISSDMKVLVSHYEMQEFLQDNNIHSRNAIYREFLMFCEKRKLYDQVRFLDETGMEVIRTNYNKGRPHIVTEERLQDKSNRYYFQDTIQLDKGEMFVSPFDLNIEGGEIEKPLKPMIRFGTPVFDHNGKKRGIVILNYFGEKLIDKLKKATDNAPGDIMLLNSDGYWLRGVRPSDEWGFMYEDKKDVTFGNLFPDEWRVISTTESGQFYNANGLFTFTTVYPLLEKSKISLASGDYKWKIVSYVKPELLSNKLHKLHKIIISACGILFVFIGSGSWFFAVAGVKRRIAELALKESEAKYRQVHATSFDGIIIANIRDEIIEVNQRVEKIFGYKAGEMVGLELIRLMPAHFRAGHKAGMKRFIETGEMKIQGTILELKGIRKNGEVFPVELTVNNFRVNKEIYFSGTIRDITQRQMKETELKEVASELKEQNEDLERFHKITVGRELEMIKLKEEVNVLLKDSGHEEKYKTHDSQKNDQ